MKNLKQSKNVFFFGFMLIMFSSCAPVFYSPGTQIQTDLEERNDLSISIYNSQGSDDNKISSKAPGVDFTIAYAPINKLGLVASRNNFKHGFSSNIPSRTSIFGEYVDHSTRYTMTNFGIGYFDKINERWKHEAYVLYGKGDLSIKSSLSEYNMGAKVQRMGLQYNLVYQKKWFSFGVLNNLSRLKYSEVNGILPRLKHLNLQNNLDNRLLETALSFGIGFDEVKLQYQIGKSMNLNNPDFDQNDTYTSIGLLFNLGKIIKKAKNKEYQK